MRKVWKHLVSGVHDHHAAMSFEIQYHDGKSARRAWFEAWYWIYRDRIGAIICELRGHDFETNGCDYVESGGEGFSCQRCGYSFTAWH
jgi:hypothetical protein